MAVDVDTLILRQFGIEGLKGGIVTPLAALAIGPIKAEDIQRPGICPPMMECEITSPVLGDLGY